MAGFNLDRNRPADWTTDPVVPAPTEQVRAAVQPGGVREGFQRLYSLIWSKLRGQVTYGALQIEVGGGDGSPPFPPLTATEGLRVVLRREVLAPRIFLNYDSATGLRVYGETLLSGFDQAGALFVRTYASQARVVVDQGSVQFQQQPPAATNLAARNTLVQELCPRAWGSVTIAWDNAGARTVTLTDAVGIDSVAVVLNGGVGMLRVFWAQNFLNTAYVVQHEGATLGGGGEAKMQLTAAKAVNYCDISMIDLSTAPPSFFNINGAITNKTVRYGFTTFGRHP